MIYLLIIPELVLGYRFRTSQIQICSYWVYFVKLVSANKIRCDGTNHRSKFDMLKVSLIATQASFSSYDKLMWGHAIDQAAHRTAHPTASSYCVNGASYWKSENLTLWWLNSLKCKLLQWSKDLDLQFSMPINIGNGCVPCIGSRFPIWVMGKTSIKLCGRLFTQTAAKFASHKRLNWKCAIPFLLSSQNKFDSLTRYNWESYHLLPSYHLWL